MLQYTVLILIGCLVTVKGKQLVTYVSPLGQHCSHYYSGTRCVTLSYLSQHSRHLIANNSVIYFLPGRHILEQDLQIHEVSNVTIRGLGIQTEGYHYTVHSNTVIISCDAKDTAAGLLFIKVMGIYFADLAIEGCSTSGSSLLMELFFRHLKSIKSVLMETINQSSSVLMIESLGVTVFRVSIVNTTGYAMTAVNLHNSLIANSSFAANNLMYPCTPQSPHKECKSGNVFFGYTYNYWNQLIGIRSTLSIANSSFSLGYSSLNTKFIYRSFGGGLTLVLDQGCSYCVRVSINAVIAFNNTARFSGNVNFFVTKPTKCYGLNGNRIQSYYGNRNYRDKNTTSGGGLQISIGTKSPITKLAKCPDMAHHRHKYVIIEDSKFNDNFGKFGGGGNIWILYHHSLHITLQNIVFSGNRGSRGIGLYMNQNLRRYNIDYYLVNITVSNSIYYPLKLPIEQDQSSSIAFFSMKGLRVINLSVLSNSPCYGVYAYYTTIQFNGQRNQFYNNTSFGNGGAIYIATSSNLNFTKMTKVDFTGNQAARFGGAIYVNNYQQFDDYCFITGIDWLSDDPNIQISFTDNKANSTQGDAIYINGCQTLQKVEKSIGSNFFKFINITNQRYINCSQISSDPYLTQHCDEKQNGIRYLKAYPGETINLLIITKGILGVNSSGLVEIQETKNSVTNVSIKDTNSYKYFGSTKCVAIPHHVTASSSHHAANNSIKLKIHTVLIQLNYNGVENQNGIHFKISVLDCPIGFTLQHSTCQCHPAIQALPNTTCNIANRQITKTDNLWISLYNNTIQIVGCPYDYCTKHRQSFNESSIDNQCDFNRTGIMCGGCSSGLSLMLGSNQCSHCSNYYLFTIIIFALAGIALVFLLLTLNMTVSMGTINGLIFYANVIKISEYSFFNSSRPLVLYQFISWLNLDIGINMCFSKDLDAVTKLWLQFIFPAYIWALIAIIIKICRHSQRFARLIGYNAVPVFATLILLSYTKALRTLVPIFMFSKASVFDSQVNHQQQQIPQQKLYWSADGNVQYLNSPEYLSLGCFALIVAIVLALPYTLLLLLQPFLVSRLNKPSIQTFFLNLKPLLDAYYGPYEQPFYIWTGLLLIVRIILVLIATFIRPGLYLSIICIIGILLLFIMGNFSKATKKTVAYTLEYWGILNITILAASVNFIPYSSYISMTIMLITFIGTLLYHVSLKLQKTKHFQKLIKRKTRHESLLSDHETRYQPLDWSSSRSRIKTTYINIP